MLKIGIATVPAAYYKTILTLIFLKISYKIINNSLVF